MTELMHICRRTRQQKIQTTHRNTQLDTGKMLTPDAQQSQNDDQMCHNHQNSRNKQLRTCGSPQCRLTTEFGNVPDN